MSMIDALLLCVIQKPAAYGVQPSVHNVQCFPLDTPNASSMLRSLHKHCERSITDISPIIYQDLYVPGASLVLEVMWVCLLIA
jgi:hypothetical protein